MYFGVYSLQILLSVDLAAEMKKKLVGEQLWSSQIFRYTVQTKDFLMRTKPHSALLYHEIKLWPDH